MQDNRQLLEVINSRFDDVISRIDDIRNEMHRSQDRHELDTKEKFLDHSIRLSDLEKLKWKLTGAVAMVVLIIQAFVKFIETKFNA